LHTTLVHPKQKGEIVQKEGKEVRESKLREMEVDVVI
jgi:hypothetical protein